MQPARKPLKERNEKRLMDTLVIPLLWMAAIGVFGYFSWLYYAVAAQPAKGAAGSGVIKHAAIKAFPKIDANVGRRITMNGNSYSTYMVDLKVSAITSYYKTPEGKPIGTFAYLKEYLDRQMKDPVFITNGGAYTKALQPLGLYVENGKEVTPVNRKPGTNDFYMEPNGVFYIKQGKAYIERTEDFNEQSTQLSMAAQGGPMLVIDGRVHPRFVRGSVNHTIKSGVGITREGKVVFVISDSGVNFYELATLFSVYFKCEQALYLDGTVSKMYLPELNRKELDNTTGFATFLCVEAIR